LDGFQDLDRVVSEERIWSRKDAEAQRREEAGVALALRLCVSARDLFGIAGSSMFESGENLVRRNIERRPLFVSVVEFSPLFFETKVGVSADVIGP
jgi:hypothetical protein